eukprot:gene17839-19620_t
MESSFAIQTFNAVLRQPFGSTSPSSNNIDSSLHSVNNDVQHNTGSLGQPTHKTIRSIITLVLGSPTHKTLASQTTFWFLVHQLTKPSKQHSGSWSSDSRNQGKHHPTTVIRNSPSSTKTTFTTPLSRIDAFVNSSFVRNPTRTQGNHQASHDSTTCSINSLHCITVASHLASLHLIHEYHDDQLEQRQSIRDTSLKASLRQPTTDELFFSIIKRLDI